ncbi:MAG TPA: hypothetical protein VFR10_08560 [bacterium]|nr:hypothetical protein [bacterium]
MKPFATMALGLLFSTAWAAEPTAHPNAPVVHQPTFAEMLTSFGSTTIPAAWAGIWNINTDNYECTLQFFLGSNADTDTLCTGDQVQDDPSMVCSGTTTDTTVNISCSGQEEYSANCVGILTYTLEATRSGDTMTGTATFSTDFEPDECNEGLPDFCFEQQITGTRVAPEPAECSTSVDEISWGQVKAFYR